jgi:uncharacterized membrane protein HdeD (DUF308 family)
MPTKFISGLYHEGLYWGGSMRWGVSLIVLGVLSGAPVLAAVTVNLVITWLIVSAGLAHLIVALHTHRIYRLIWRLIVVFAYVLFGVYLIAYPVLGWVSLTLVLSRLFLFEGIFDILVFFRFVFRTFPGSEPPRRRPSQVPPKPARSPIRSP